MDNPFTKNYPDQTDTSLVLLATAGDKPALQSLILRHQVFVYNLALKLTGGHADAEDLTQEVLIKAVTALSRFEGKSNFRTWLYRITVNHFLNDKKRKSLVKTLDFETYFNTIDNIPVHELNEQEKTEMSNAVEELRIRCTTGMLLCLDKTQRMIYILGDMFEINHRLGAEIMGISASNFRVRLMRARNDLRSWMSQRCGLINPDNPCRCAKKTKGFIEAGIVDPENLKFNTHYKMKIAELSRREATTFVDTVDSLQKQIFQSHPFQEPVNADKFVDEVFGNEIIKTVMKI